MCSLHCSEATTGKLQKYVFPISQSVKHYNLVSAQRLLTLGETQRKLFHATASHCDILYLPKHICFRNHLIKVSQSVPVNPTFMFPVCQKSWHILLTLLASEMEIHLWDRLVVTPQPRIKVPKVSSFLPLSPFHISQICFGFSKNCSHGFRIPPNTLRAAFIFHS